MSAVFSYTARALDGRRVAGALQSDTAEAALAHLRARALCVTSLEDASSARGALVSLATCLPLRASARLAFFRSLATLMRAGVPLRKALQVTIDQCGDGRLTEALRSVSSDIESGAALSVAFSRRPREFTRLHVAMVRAGEVGGVLDEVLERIAQLLERDRAVRKRLTAALAYPAVVAFAALALVLFLVANIVPAFAGIFQEMHVELPVTTRLLIAVGSVLSQPRIAWLVPASGVAIVLAGRLALDVPAVARAYEGIVLSTPLLGGILRKAIVARLCRTLGSLLRSGVAVLAALDATSDVLESRLYCAVVSEVAHNLREGQSFGKPLEASGLFDPLFLQLVRVGEETGTLDAMLLRIAEYYDVDIETALATLGSVVEPLLIVFLGSAVGVIVASIILPLYSVIGSIK